MPSLQQIESDRKSKVSKLAKELECSKPLAEYILNLQEEINDLKYRVGQTEISAAEFCQYQNE